MTSCGTALAAELWAGNMIGRAHRRPEWEESGRMAAARCSLSRLELTVRRDFLPEQLAPDRNTGFRLTLCAARSNDLPAVQSRKYQRLETYILVSNQRRHSLWLSPRATPDASSQAGVARAARDYRTLAVRATRSLPTCIAHRSKAPSSIRVKRIALSYRPLDRVFHRLQDSSAP